MVKNRQFYRYIIIMQFIFFVAVNAETGVLAVFNAHHLGWREKDMYNVAKIISFFDITGLVEVMNEDGLIELHDELEKITSEEWEYHISSHSVGSENYREYYGYVYKKDKVNLIETYGFFDDQNNKFVREPYGAFFEMGEFDFVFVLFHAIYGDSVEQREAEARKIYRAYNYFQDISGSFEKDIIIGGDFNLPACDRAFDSLFALDEEIYYLVPTHKKTTIGHSGLVNAYDNIFFSVKYTGEFTGNYGVFNFAEDNHIEARKYISDHLPVYMEFNTLLDFD